MLQIQQLVDVFVQYSNNKVASVVIIRVRVDLCQFGFSVVFKHVYCLLYKT